MAKKIENTQYIWVISIFLDKFNINEEKYVHTTCSLYYIHNRPSHSIRVGDLVSWSKNWTFCGITKEEYCNNKQCTIR